MSSTNVVKFGHPDARERADTVEEKNDVKTGIQYSDYICFCAPCFSTNGSYALDEAVYAIRQNRGAKNFQRLAEWKDSVDNPRPVGSMTFLSTDVAAPAPDAQARTTDDLEEGIASSAGSTLRQPFARFQPKAQPGSRRDLRRRTKFTFNSLKDAFAPIAAILLLKSIDVREAYEESKRYRDFLDRGQAG